MPLLKVTGKCVLIYHGSWDATLLIMIYGGRILMPCVLIKTLTTRVRQLWLHGLQLQRAIDNYRQYIILQIPTNQAISIYPDMDNLYAGNPGVSDSTRQTIISHWIGAAANPITASDLTNLDNLGVALKTSPEDIAIANITAQFPMQPRNPGTGGTDSKQLQALIARPSPATKEAVVILANYAR